jgi:hypothetical protein
MLLQVPGMVEKIDMADGHASDASEITVEIIEPLPGMLYVVGTPLRTLPCDCAVLLGGYTMISWNFRWEMYARIAAHPRYENVGIDEVQFYVDNQPVGVALSPPYACTIFHGRDVVGWHNIRVVAVNGNGETAEDSLDVFFLLKNSR